MSKILRLLLIILAVYRIAQMITKEEGPFMVFHKLQGFTDRHRVNEQHRGQQNGIWATVDETIRCPYCFGIWLSFLVVWIYLKPKNIKDFLLYSFGIAGGQSVLQNLE